jgi:FkbM family methyltransferase
MIQPFLSFIRDQLRNFGLDVRKMGHVGEQPFADMKYFLKGETSPLVFDVGANVGQSVTTFKRAFPKSTIHSFEPSPATFAKLSTNCAAIPGVHLWNQAMGSSVGQLPFLENSCSDMSSFLEQGIDGWGTIEKTTVVDVMTLDEFAREKGINLIHILKSDTQGYDLEVFKGAAGLLNANKIALIYCEVTFSDMYKNSAKFDQIFNFLIGHNFVLVSFYRKFFQNDTLGWTDLLFVNKEYLPKPAGR